MRRDLITWLVLSDIAAVLVPSGVLMVSGAAAAGRAALAGVIMIAMAWALGALRVDVVDQARSGWTQVLAGAVVTAPVAVLLAQHATPRAPVVSVLGPLAAQAALAVAGRAAESSWLRRRRVEGHGLRRTLIVMGNGAEPVLRQLRRHPGDGFLIVGYLSSGEGRAPNATPVGDVASLARTVRSERIDVVMTLGGVTPDSLVSIMRALDSTGARLVIAPGLQDVVPRRMHGLPVTHGWSGLIDVRLRRTAFGLKNLVDRLGGALIIVLASPVLAAAALAIRLDSPGPVFYTQTRVGLRGKTFTMWKLRSMYVDADERRAALVASGGDAGNEILFKDRKDPRITRVGRFIRRTSLDELPQLFNVVRGEMSLVGPRPALPHEVAEYDEEARRRLLVKPGMTGLWQVSGRSDLSWESTVALDRHYVENRGAALDTYVLAATLRAVAGGKGAY
ncbi:sugar transferase [Actinomyces howellii]|uniref:Colanic biosynthesis UDP-glucose lipid carrier transferase n=1 Tax=Actinomyces howellii TaxID=52771 RepID=A0A448HIW5_9ACTO|nr:sugar transferase [Actinomyces howellii]VEG29641.1 Putative colanic biosynthesis UDP-glucose lipid carrier transferase [Actinomyces howellii]